MPTITLLGLMNLSWRACRPVLAVLLLTAVLAVLIDHFKSVPPTGPSLDDWDIPTLVTYLNGQGLGLRMVSTQEDGANEEAVFLTTTDKGWDDFNRLPNDPERRVQWEGTLYCQRGPGGVQWSELTRLWSGCCVVVGPFLLYGDRELLDRVAAALPACSQPSRPVTRAPTPRAAAE
jgi:hypothetical protein